MFDHLSLGVRDLDAARRFYDAFFAPLGASVSSASAKELAYGPDGQLVSGSFMDYLLPTALEAPPVRVRVTEDAPAPLNPLGAKGAGEGGTAAAGAVLAAAVSDALGAEPTALPLTPERVARLARRKTRTPVAKPVTTEVAA